MAFQGEVARVVLRYSVAAGAAGCEGLKTMVQQLPQVQSVASVLANSSLQGGAQVQQEVAVKAEGYWVTPPKLAVAYSCAAAAGATQDKKIMTWLPVHVGKFNVPVECSREQYFAVWAKMSAPGSESVQVMRRNRQRQIVNAGVERCRGVAVCRGRMQSLCKWFRRGCFRGDVTRVWL